MEIFERGAHLPIKERRRQNEKGGKDPHAHYDFATPAQWAFVFRADTRCRRCERTSERTCKEIYDREREVVTGSTRDGDRFVVVTKIFFRVITIHSGEFTFFSEKTGRGETHVQQ